MELINNKLELALSRLNISQEDLFQFHYGTIDTVMNKREGILLSLAGFFNTNVTIALFLTKITKGSFRGSYLCIFLSFFVRIYFICPVEGSHFQRTYIAK